MSFVTEQVAAHTNGTIGALLNATFGNAPELLISVAALRSGFYRVVQLTMLGSMITNMMFVFGVSCLIGGLRWQVQDIRLTSGNVSVGMLLVATAGSLIPATLILSGQFPTNASERSKLSSGIMDKDTTPTREEITLSRVNAAVMFMLYICYLIFQIGTHKDEFDDHEHTPQARPNVFCRNSCSWVTFIIKRKSITPEDISPLKGLKKRNSVKFASESPECSVVGKYGDEAIKDEEEALVSDFMLNDEPFSDTGEVDVGIWQSSERRRRRDRNCIVGSSTIARGSTERSKSRCLVAGAKSTNDECDSSDIRAHEVGSFQHSPLISMRVGIIWLFVITLCISAMTDVLVDTIDGFAERMNLSEVFTSMIIIPFFSNVAEQVSAFLFAYRNEMDLCVGVTIGSAIQIATFVLPGSVLIGMLMDRSMTLYFHSYETACLFFCTVVVAAVLQGGTTNWLVGAMLLGIYIMFAAGIWFHEIEDLDINTEDLITSMHNGE